MYLDTKTPRLPSWPPEATQTSGKPQIAFEDAAIGTANWLFGSRRRIGQVQPEDLDEKERQNVVRNPRVEIVDVDEKAGHAYFINSPAASSDMILLLRYERLPGAENGRPLTEVFPRYYRLDKNYMAPGYRP